MQGLRLWRLKNRMILATLVSNFFGIQVTQLVSHRSLAPPTPEVLELLQCLNWRFLPLAFLALCAGAFVYERPIRQVINARFDAGRPAPEAVVQCARRRLLNEPFVLMAFNLWVWLLAAALYSWVFYRHGTEAWIILRSLIQITVAGVITTLIVFFSLERMLQKGLVPVFFPAGGLCATPGTLRIRIRTRLGALLVACNLIPSFIIVSIISISYAMDKSPALLLDLLRPTFLTNAVIFMGVGVLVTLLVGENLTQPLSGVIEVLQKVRQGDLDHRVRVTSNDEIGYTGDVINEMTQGLKERLALRQALELAREVQQSLLPGPAPALNGIDIAGRSLYCEQTGGDYYDFLELDAPPAGRLGVVVGDVSGHGISSALLMATARAFLRLRSSMPGTAARVVTDVNRQLTRDLGDSGQFMTLFYLVLDPAAARLRWVRAGHEPAILYDPAADTFKTLGGKGIALGIDEGWQYEEHELTGFGRGQVLLLGTDGIWEARNREGGMFGKAPLYGIIRQHHRAGAAEITDRILAALDAFRQGNRREDDTTLIVIKG